MKYLIEYRLFESAEAILKATAGFGTDEEALVKAIIEIQSADELAKIDAELAANGSAEYKSVKAAVDGELGIFDRVYKQMISKKFEELGLTSYLKDGIIPAQVKKSQAEPVKSQSTASGETKKLSQGKVSINSNKSAPLIVVFGGIDVGGRTSGDYMYDYFKEDTLGKTTTFVANSSRIDGVKAWDEISQLGLSPSKKILYLFSGGYLPGMSLLAKVPAENWDKIYLVDIWIGNNQNTQKIYTELAEAHPDKVKYYYTGGENGAGGSNNLTAKKEIIAAVKDSKAASSHMGANDIAVTDLKSDIA